MIQKTPSRYWYPIMGISPYVIPHQGTPGTWKFSDDWTSWGLPKTKTIYYNNWEAYNLGARSTLFNMFHRTHIWKNGPSRLLEFIWWILLVRLSKMKLTPSFGVNRFAEKLHCGNTDAPTKWSDLEARTGSPQTQWYTKPPPDIGIP